MRLVRLFAASARTTHEHGQVPCLCASAVGIAFGSKTMRAGIPFPLCGGQHKQGVREYGTAFRHASVKVTRPSRVGAASNRARMTGPQFVAASRAGISRGNRSNAGLHVPRDHRHETVLSFPAN
ncbi:hypothetical protein SAMN06265795_1302 [Noviherbaspirillum humi]|uniref:Uncharacterized protein n=1 Tax=Noviherbaspirillum humi TaxID=1688639 RepID=A0A239M281_9BURK|nr:hypothetical protein [Noviherbaspirillum humi]SNT36826.1 hypothetical protein SAMN06265795_1302 [Noviherbaspirillum humi]